MRACMLAYAFYENDGRIRRYAESLIARGVEVDIISLRRKGQTRSEIVDGAHVFRIQERSRNESGKWDYFFKVAWFLINSFFFLTLRHMRVRYAIVHIHNVPDFEIFAALVPKLMGAKIILDIHEPVPEIYAYKFNIKEDSIILRSLKIIEKLSCAFSDHVIITNDFCARKVCERAVKPEKCTSIINYPNLRIFSQLNSQKKSSAEYFTLIYPGSLNRHQGLDIAVKAMSMVRKEIPHARFHIYGEGPEKENLKSLITDLKLNNIVLLHDSVNLSEVAHCMATSDLGIVPKKADFFGDLAFSTKILEFMAVGVPVVVSETLIDRFYFDESLVMFFNSEDEGDLATKILALYRDASLRLKLINNGLQFIRQNNWQVKEVIYLKIINSILGTNLFSLS